MSGIRRDPAGCANIALTPAILLRIARGFLCFFWGLPIGLLLFTGAMSLAAVPRVRLPAYVIGVLIAYCGIIYLRRAGPLTPLWDRRLRAAILLMLLQVYLAPFVHWWERMPAETYFAANVMVLLFATAWTFFVINMLAAEMARVLHNTIFRVEAQLSAWISFFFMLTPLFEVLAISVSFYSTFGRLFFMDATPVIMMIPRWASVLTLVSFALTMAVVWKAKEQALLRVASWSIPGRSEVNSR